MYKQFKEWFYRTKARRTLINRYEYLHEVDALLEEYLTSKLLRGGSEEFISKGRNDLANKQAEMRENSSFVSFLRSQK